MLQRRIAAVAIAAITLAACAPVHPQAAAQAKPPPRNPDVTPVVERFYGQVEAGHLRIAYATLSAAYRARTTRDAFDALYGDMQNAQIDARQSGDRVVIAQVTIPAGGGHAIRAFRESLRCSWDGDAWIIDAIDRRATAAP